MEITTTDFVIKFDLIGSDIFVIKSGEFEWDRLNMINFYNGDSYLTLYMFDDHKEEEYMPDIYSYAPCEDPEEDYEDEE